VITHWRTLSTVEAGVMHSRRTSASQAARSAGVTSGGNWNSSPATVGDENANTLKTVNFFNVMD